MQCPAKRSCGSDITLGDYWGIQAEHPEVDYDSGVSAVLCNTVKGVAAIDAVKPWVQWGRSSLQKVLPGNSSLVRSATPYGKRNDFLGDLGGGMGIDGLMGKYGFKPSLKQHMRGKLDGVKLKVFKMIGVG